ncbi:MAG: hypothetical protein EPN26_04840 [Rhodospirillales bacterium]|nr:MAG: hypothetical protein EPN26_04840 [Rhodospirillales bacterium]
MSGPGSSFRSTARRNCPTPMPRYSAASIAVTVWEALTRIARCGRAAPILQGGAIRVVRDEPQTVPVAMFGPRNIVKNSLKIQYIMPSDDTADAVTVSYFSDRTWKPDEVTAKLPDSAAENPAKVSLFGCTAKEHALREGDFIAADNRYRRKMVSFRTELDGMIPTFTPYATAYCYPVDDPMGALPSPSSCRPRKRARPWTPCGAPSGLAARRRCAWAPGLAPPSW